MRKELKEAFEKVVEQAFPGLERSSEQYFDLEQMFFVGLVTGIAEGVNVLEALMILDERSLVIEQRMRLKALKRCRTILQ